MSSKVYRRDYSITGPEKKAAEEKGLVSAEWYISPVPRKRLKELMKRKDGPAIRDTLIWFATLIVSGILAYLAWGTWWAIPAFLLYGALYITPAESRWHECSHGTPFKTSWMNEALYQISSFMCMKPATPLRWSHTRHHTDTVIVGRDPEIKAPRPPIWSIIFMEICRLYVGPMALGKVFLRCFGKLTKEEEEYIPESERNKTFWEARVWMLVYASVIAYSCTVGSILPIMFILLPIFYGSYIHFLFGAVQHLGLEEDVLDHRLNSRTFYSNPLVRFLYWNMNYHIEHHMFPMVPYHALPALHEEMKQDCPSACPSLRAAVKETFLALWKQRKDPGYVIDRPLPSTAHPYVNGPAAKVPASQEWTPVAMSKERQLSR